MPSLMNCEKRAKSGPCLRDNKIWYRELPDGFNVPSASSVASSVAVAVHEAMEAVAVNPGGSRTKKDL